MNEHPVPTAHSYPHHVCGHSVIASSSFSPECYVSPMRVMEYNYVARTRDRPDGEAGQGRLERVESGGDGTWESSDAG